MSFNLDNKMNFAYASIGGKTLNVYSYDEYLKNKDILTDKDSDAAVRIEDNGNEYVLPVREPSIDMKEPGIYPNQKFDFFSMPTTEEEKTQYSPKVFDFSNSQSLQEIVTKHEEFDSMRNQILETPDNITSPPLKEADAPEMRALKEAILAKHIDIDKYKERFGANFPNDKRKLNDTQITLFIMKRYCENLDLEMDLTIKDKNGNIANPMGKVITANVFPGNSNSVNIFDKDEYNNLFHNEEENE